MHLKDKVVVITGAARGLGKAFAIDILEKGAKVAVVDILEEEGITTTEELWSRYDNRALFIKCDVTNKKDCEGVFKQTTEKFGPVDVLINNAAMQTRTMDAYDKIVAVNMTSVITMTYLAVDHMSKDKGGSGGIIVNISSVAGLIAFPGFELYAATKHAVTGFTRTMAANARENPSWGVKVFALGPGWVRTPMTQWMYDNPEKNPAPDIKFIEPEVVSKAMISLLSEEPGEEDFMLVTDRGSKYLKLRETYESMMF